MSRTPLSAYSPVARSEALRVLGVDAALGEQTRLAQIASVLDDEVPALRWVVARAHTTGWASIERDVSSWNRLPALLGTARLPWHDEIAAARAALGDADRALLALLVGCDAPFSWDVLEAIEPAVSIESVCRLVDDGWLLRRAEEGVVAFSVPYCVRAVHRAEDPVASAGAARRWIEGWALRTEALGATSYGPSARGALFELGCAVRLAERALGDEGPVDLERALAIWIGAADAIFFCGAVDFDSPAFARAVVIADAHDAPGPRARARLALARALLERGDAAGATLATKEALRLAHDAAREDLRVEAFRGVGWAALGAASLAEAASAFEDARRLAEAIGDPRSQADALAGLGMLALLGGDAGAARARLAEARAIHVVMRDAPREAAVVGMMELLPERLDEAIDVAALEREVVALRSSGQRWREALVLARLGLGERANGAPDRERAYLVEARAAATLARVPTSKLVDSLVDAHSTARPAIVVGSEGLSLSLPSGEAHDLTRHGPLRRVLWALARSRVEAPGAASSTLDLVARGWPGEKMSHAAATLRVYQTIRRLRALGLGDVLVTRDEGYLLDPETPVMLRDFAS